MTAGDPSLDIFGGHRPPLQEDLMSQKKLLLLILTVVFALVAMPLVSLAQQAPPRGDGQGRGRGDGQGRGRGDEKGAPRGDGRGAAGGGQRAAAPPPPPMQIKQVKPGLYMVI